MRTTLSLDDDVTAVLDRLRRERDGSLKQIVNEALRRGLAQMARGEEPVRRYRTESVDLGRCLLGSVDDVAETLAVAEGERFA